MIHELKCKSCFFTAIKDGAKTFEIRKNDRDYQVGDFLALNETKTESREEYYTGDSIIARVVYILDDKEYVPEGYVAMGIALARIEYNDKTYHTVSAKLRPIRREK